VTNVQKNFTVRKTVNVKFTLNLFITLFVAGYVILLPSMSFSAIDPSPRHHLIEHFQSAIDLGRYSLAFIKELEQNNANIDTVLYFVDEPSYRNHLVPNLYGFKRLQYLFESIPIDSPLVYRTTIINQRDRVFAMMPDLYQRVLAYVYQHIHQSTTKPSLKLQSVHLSKSDSDPCKFTGHYLFSWGDDISGKDLNDFHYNLFLIADEFAYEINRQNFTIHNVAYDFIPFTGDDVKQYTGKGFPLMNSSRLIEEKAKTLLLSTESFPLPEKDSLAHHGQVKTWSLHLFIENQHKELVFSKKVRIR
jgi:hypothetical protein